MFQRLPNAPKFSFGAGFSYGIPIGPGKVVLDGDVAYQSKVYFTPFNIDVVSRPSNTKLNAFLTYEGDNWSASIYGRNLTNKTTVANALIGSGLFGFAVNGTLDPPRTYGIEIGYRF